MRKAAVFFVFILFASTGFAGTLNVDGIGGTPGNYATLSAALAIANATTEDCTITFSTVGPIYESGVLGDINPNTLQRLIVDGNVGGQRAEIVTDATTAGDLAHTYIDAGQTYTFKNLIFRPSWRGGAEAAHNGFELNDSGGVGEATTEFINCIFTGSTATGMADPFDTTLTDAEVTGFLGGTTTGIIVSSSIDANRPQNYHFENTILAWSGGSAIVCYGEFVTMNLGPGFVISNCQGSGDGIYGSSTGQSGYFNIHLRGEENNRNLIYRTSSGIDISDPDMLVDMEYTDIIECADRLLNQGVSGEGALVRAATHCIFYHGASGGLRYSAWNSSATDITFDHCTVYDSDGNQLLWTGSASGVYNDFWFTDTIMADPDIGGVGRDIRAGNDSHDGHWDYCALYNVYWYGDLCQTAGPRWWQTNMVGTPCSGDAPDPLFISTDVADYLPADLADWDATKITLNDDFFMDVSNFDYHAAASDGGALSGAAQYHGPVNLIVDGVGGTPYHYALLSTALAAANSNLGDVTISFTTVGPIYEPGVLGNINPNFPLQNLVVDGNVGGQRAEIITDATTAGDLAHIYIDGGQTYTFKNLIFRPSWRGGAEAAHNGFELDDSTGGDTNATVEFINCVFTGTTASGLADPFSTTLTDAEVTGFLGGTSTGIMVSSSLSASATHTYHFEDTILAWSGGSAIVCYGEKVFLNGGPGFVIANCQGANGHAIYAPSSGVDGFYAIRLAGTPENRNLIFNTQNAFYLGDPDVIAEIEYTDIIQCRDRWFNLPTSGEGGFVKGATQCVFYEGAQGGLRYTAWNSQVPDITFDHCTFYDTDGANQFLWCGSRLDAGADNNFRFADCILADPDGAGCDIRSGQTIHKGYWDYCAIYNLTWYSNPGCQTDGSTWYQTNMVGTPCSGDAPDPMFISTSIADYLPANLTGWDAQKITLSDDFFMDVSDWRYQGAGSGGSDLSGAADFLLPVSEWHHYLD